MILSTPRVVGKTSYVPDWSIAGDVAGFFSPALFFEPVYPDHVAKNLAVHENGETTFKKIPPLMEFLDEGFPRVHKCPS